MNDLILIKPTISTFERHRLSAAVHCLPRFGRMLIKLLCATIIMQQGRCAILRVNNPFIDTVVYIIRLSIPFFSATHIFASQEHSSRLTKTAVIFFIHKHNTSRWMLLNHKHKFFTSGLKTHMARGVHNGGCKTHFGCKDTILRKRIVNVCQELFIHEKHSRLFVLVPSRIKGIQDNHIKFLFFTGILRSKMFIKPLAGFLVDNRNFLIIKTVGCATNKVGAVG
mmetsp:Transcript_38717/g.58141  ORF Transcript_38717/g.58141 Transcript_38717/m.58141 type:complete len:224 (+) Transcript_38717:705-1376(+)